MLLTTSPTQGWCSARGDPAGRCAPPGRGAPAGRGAPDQGSPPGLSRPVGSGWLAACRWPRAEGRTPRQLRSGWLGPGRCRPARWHLRRPRWPQRRLGSPQHERRSPAYAWRSRPAASCTPSCGSSSGPSGTRYCNTRRPGTGSSAAWPRSCCNFDICSSCASPNRTHTRVPGSSARPCASPPGDPPCLHRRWQRSPAAPRGGSPRTPPSPCPDLPRLCPEPKTAPGTWGSTSCLALPMHEPCAGPAWPLSIPFGWKLQKPAPWKLGRINLQRGPT
mmetsp:Transcript_11644/g.27743  ORF Transcript_11644/g.27743 Transcript_11644/m.27743 type:complete len:276 (-) Transcript_11644:567-1394(-)